jgi:polar amino acid transport system substrate-binding protein
MWKINLSMVLVAILVIGAFALACAAPSSTSDQVGGAPPPSSGQTFQQLAEAGKTVYAASCGKCHGANGEGVTAPTLIGTNTNLPAYNNAQGLLDFINTQMPFDAPGSLTQQQYLEVLSFILLQNKMVAPDTVLDTSKLPSIPLK